MTKPYELTMNLEERSFRNLIWHYREELACIEKGAHARNLLNKLEKTHLGARAYHDAYKKEFWTLKKETRAEHIRHIKIQGDMNNNKMERLNGENRDREKVMRGLKNLIRPSLQDTRYSTTTSEDMKD